MIRKKRKERLLTMSYVKKFRNGFTLIEMLIVVVILSIAAMAAIPMFSSGADMQIRSAANMIASDLEYARSMAISRGQNYKVVFDKDAESYSIKDQTGTIVNHPVKKGFPYTINFKTDSRLSKVNINATTFSSDTVTFDYIGSPDNGGIVTLAAGSITTTVRVEPITGFITIQ